MTVNKLLPTIRIHPILIVFLIISFFTGTFVHLFLILGIVFFHELGHYTMARVFGWKINYIMLWIFGGVMVTEETDNRPFHEELLVTLAGPFQHVFVYLAVYLYSISHYTFIPTSLIEMISFYNMILLLFNLLPIYPLDGGKVVFSLLTQAMPFRKAHTITLIASMILCLLFLIIQIIYFSFNLSILLLISFLFMENKSEWKRRYYVFIQFLLNRYHGKSSVKKISYIKTAYDMPLSTVFRGFKKGEKHIINVQFPDNRSMELDENECLRSYFHERKINVPIGEL